MQQFAVLIILALLLGSVLGWVSFLRVSSLKKEIEAIRKELGIIRSRQQDGPLSHSTSPSEPQSSATAAQISAAGASGQDDIALAVTRSPGVNVKAVTDESEVSWKGPLEKEPPETPAQDAENTPSLMPSDKTWLQQLKEQWMVWLGGLCVGLSGIFMVRYSIEQGLLGPLARIALAAITGVFLHFAAEWARRHSVGSYQALAALAGGASITLFAALLAALHLYQLIPPLLAFVLLGVVSLATMALAVLHGPLLAIMGILGAYAVPILVDTGSGSIAGVLLYALVISVSALALMQYVYRYWIWAGMLVGGLSWWFLSILSNDANTIRGFYLTALAYLIIATPLRDWLLTSPDRLKVAKDKVSKWQSSLDIAEAPIRLSLLLIMAAFGLSILSHPSIGNAIIQWSPLVFLLFLASRFRLSLRWLPWLSLGIQCAAWLILGMGSVGGAVQIVGYAGAEQTDFISYAGWMSILYCALALWNFRLQKNSPTFLSLALLSPLIWLALCYLLVAGFAQSWVWGSVAVAAGVIYLILAAVQIKRGADTETIAWLTLAGHFAYSLAAAILLREAGLTLALSAQILSLAWVIKRYRLEKLSLLLKIVLAVVVVRLTTNPWLLSYPSDVHWSLWSYGGSAVFCALAAWQFSTNDKLRRWLEVAAAHLLVLTLWAELRYWIYDGEIFVPRLELLEMAINTALWSCLGLIYYLRSKVSNNLQTIYIWMSRVLLLMAAAGYLCMATIMNPLWGIEEVGSTPILNLLLLAYGFPVVACLLVYRYYDEHYRQTAAVLAGCSAFLFVSIEIRHLWQGQLDLNLPTSSGELYTYSIVWLLMAILTMLAGGARYGLQIYRAGLALLIVVIGKLFLVDMADLEGLLRVASFMGLGLSLLGLAYLYQRFNFKHRID